MAVRKNGNMDLLHGMQVFGRVIECDGFSAAAQSLELSAAQVSRIVAELERHLQTRLLHRTTRRLRLTEAGEQFLARSRQILELTDQAVDQARGAHLTPRGRLRVHSSHGIGLLMMPLVAQYNARYPDVVIELTLSQRNPDPLEEGHDVVIAIGQELPDSNLVALPLGRIFSVLCASPDYLRQHGCPQRPEDLQQHRCLRMVDPLYEEHWLFERPEGDWVHLPQNTFQTNVAEAMIKAIESGMGIGLIPVYAATAALRAGRLKRVLPRDRLRERSLNAIYPSRHYLDAKVRTWVDFLREGLPEQFELHLAQAQDPSGWAQQSVGRL